MTELRSDPAPDPSARAAVEEVRRQLEEVAGPVIAQVIARKSGLAPGGQGRFHGNSAEALDAEDAASLARTRIARALLERRGIADLRSYSAGVAYHAWDETLHRRFPSRRRLLHRVRYVLEGQAARAIGYAVWEADGVEIAGRAAWRGSSPGAEAAARVQSLQENAAGFLRKHFGARRFLDLSPVDLLRECFGELGGPVPWSELANLLGELWQVGGGRAEGERVEQPEIEGWAEAATSLATQPDQQLSWLENLRWLWREICALPLRPRTAFLLHVPVTRELEQAGVATLRDLAAALELPAEELAGLWSEIPLDDLRIAARLGTARQQVINLRKSARLHLGRRLAEYLRV